MIDGHFDVVQLRDVNHLYGKFPALHEVSLNFFAGDLVFLVGRSGAGKSTILRLINREIAPTSGEIWVDGIAAHDLPLRRVAELRRRVGMVFQDFKLLPRLSAVENVVFALRVVNLSISKKQAHTRSMDALEAVGIEELSNRYPHQLSGGQQQRLAIARAVVSEPKVLLADEPTGNLDVESADDIMQLLVDVSNWGTAVIMATHNLEMVERINARTVGLEEGKVKFDHPAGEVSSTLGLAR